MDNSLTFCYDPDVTTQIGYSMKVAVRRTGLSPHVIRIWEKRYGAVKPARTATKRRIYSDSDIERLRLLKRAIEVGHSIGRIVDLSGEQLTDLIGVEERIGPPRDVRNICAVQPIVQDFMDKAVQSVQELDADALEGLLARASVELSRPVLLDRLVLPLMTRIGELWREGTLRVVHEHLASAIVRSFLGSIERGSRVGAAGPTLAVATPAGQMHEFGALIAASAAASEGWRVKYLGPNLPAEEIAGAASQSRAGVIALSIVYPADDPRLMDELKRLHHLLPPGVMVLVGGRASDSYAGVLDSIAAIRLTDMAAFRSQLEMLRVENGRA